MPATVRCSAGVDALDALLCGFMCPTGPAHIRPHLRRRRGVGYVFLQAARVGGGVVKDDGVPDAEVLHIGVVGGEVHACRRPCARSELQECSEAAGSPRLCPARLRAQHTCSGRPASSQGASLMASSTSIPSATSPKMVCWCGRHGGASTGQGRHSRCELGLRAADGSARCRCLCGRLMRTGIAAHLLIQTVQALPRGDVKLRAIHVLARTCGRVGQHWARNGCR